MSEATFNLERLRQKAEDIRRDRYFLRDMYNGRRWPAQCPNASLLSAAVTKKGAREND